MSAAGPFIRPEPRPLPDPDDIARRRREAIWATVFGLIFAVALIFTPPTATAAVTLTVAVLAFGACMACAGRATRP